MTDRWEAAAPMRTARSNHTATLLTDGRVLVAGGDTIGSYYGAATPNAEIYDPARDVWTPVAGMTMARLDHSATRLADGRVLVTGGIGREGTAPIASAEIYDPVTDRWTPAASLSGPTYRHTALLLPGGAVLIPGGERYDPAADRWTPVAPIPVPAEAVRPDFPPGREGFSITALPDGQVLVAGSQVPQGCVPQRSSCIARPPIRLADTERYDPAADRWVADAPLTVPRAFHTAVFLPGGRVLVVGGNQAGGAAPEPYTAEIYTPPPPPSACFAETGECIGGSFLTYWRANGGLAQFGFPLTGERRETLEDGREYTVQYFERVRLELHPENAPPHDVLLGHFGRRWLRTVDLPAAADPAPAPPRPDTAYFPQTGHNLGGQFLDYWLANGGLMQFGYPLTEEFEQTLEDNRRYTVQYFERARFERHPGNPPPYDVLLGQFGRRILLENQWLDGEPGFKAAFVTDEWLQAALGRPGGPVARGPAAYQAFERGAMLWQGDLRLIYVLCGDTPAAGDSVRTFPDPWQEGQPGGGGPGPRPGLYEPQRGFGMLWRENEAVRDCLGYATSPDETGYDGARLNFLRGTLLTAATPEGRVIYAAYRLREPSPCGTGSTPPCRFAYERFPDLSGR